MWIVPKTLSAFVPDTEGLNLVLDEQAWMLESSAMWRSKPSSKQTWLRRLKKGGWITHLSGRILKPSLHQSFVEKYTDSLEDIHANHSVQQESEKEKTTQDTYGPTSDSTSGQLDLFGASLKMSEATPRWGYGESCPIWKKMVTERSSDCSRRRKRARLTNASECSSWRGWATPMSGTKDHMGSSVEYYQRRQRIGKQVDLNGQVILDKWATPQASDHIEGARTAKESNQKCLGRDLNQMNWPTPRETMSRDATYDRGKCNLGEVVHNPKNWPTPRAGNPGSRKPGTGGKILAEEAKKHNGLPVPEKSNMTGKNHGSPKLNPNWVEQLMGLPVGWTQLPTEWTDSASSEMALSANVQK